MRINARAAMLGIAAALLPACSGGGASTSSLTPASGALTTSALSAPGSTTASSVSSTSTDAVNASHSPPPTAAQVAARTVSANQYGPAHAPTFEQLSGVFQTSQSGWNTVGKYVSYLLTDKRGVNYAANAGIKVGFYTDPILIHGSDIQAYPEAAFAHSCSNQRIYTTSSGVAAYLGNPGSSAEASTWYGDIKSMQQDQYGKYNYSFAFADDSGDPGEVWNPGVFQVGGAGGSTASPVYCGYSQSSWFSNIENLYQNAPLPVMFNDDTASQYENYMQGHSNVIGGECEGCISSPFLGGGQTKVNGSSWVTQMNAGLADIYNHKIFFLSADGAVPADTLGYMYASYMLMYDQNYSLIRADAQTHSGIGNPPLVQIVPTQPLVATPSNLNSLSYGNGVYAREYAACYINGTLAGPCATVVNSDPSNSHPWPWLSREYHHLVQFGGSGAATALGDNGYVNANGAHPGSSVSASGWAIAFN